VTSYIESAACVAGGGADGIEANVMVAALFLAAMFFFTRGGRRFRHLRPRRLVCWWVR